MNAPLSFGILGPLEVWDGGRFVPIAAAKQRVLLASLLLRTDGQATLTELYTALWGENLPLAPKAAVHNYVRRLRKALGNAAITTTPGGYRLAIDVDQVDLYRFRAHVSHARQLSATGDLINEAATLSEALTLWRGAPLADVPSDTLQRTEVPGLVEERTGALERRITVDLELGAHAELISELRRLTSEHPLRERFWAQLILALHRDERSAEALAAYRQARTVLAEEIGIDPGAELQALYQRILDGDPALAATPRGVVSVPIPRRARHRLPPDFPPDVTPLVGREEATERLTRLLVPEARPITVPIVLLTGSSGVGKTALAVHIGHRLRTRFPDGQLYANLQAHALDRPVSAADLLPRFLRQLGGSTELIPVPFDEQVARYRSLLADRQILVVLDDVTSIEQVCPLLPEEAGSAAIIVSRTDLPVLNVSPLSHRLLVDVLPPGPALRLLDAVVGDDRVSREPAAAERLVELCGRHPLALRIAGAGLAARAGLPIGGYVAEFAGSRRVPALSVPADHEEGAVYAAFEFAYLALPAPVRRSLRFLGLIPGLDFTPPVAAALLNTSPAAATATLGTLVAANMVENDVPGRYRMHDLLRYYAVRLGTAEDIADERAAARRRVIDFYAYARDLAAKTIESARPPAGTTATRPPEFTDQLSALAWLASESANLHAALADQDPFLTSARNEFEIDHTRPQNRPISPR